jgi:D-alanyl-D-alanine carboxypeptidase/D-alanyl-D-alanine-endopeptidase (penicillin-binding protein 4)
MMPPGRFVGGAGVGDRTKRGSMMFVRAALFGVACVAGFGPLAAGRPSLAADSEVPAEIAGIIGAPKYAGATWGIRAVDLKSAKPVLATGPDSLFFTGSVRKLFSVGLALNALGADHRFVTPVYHAGDLTPDGVLAGDLILVASGDLTLGGRDKPDGAIAFTNFDHTESNSLGSSILTDTDPLAGIASLARQVAAAGVRDVTGDVVVDDRLFDHFRVPNGNVLITPVIVNDNLIDVTIVPTEAGKPARVDWRPKSAAFSVEAEVVTVAAGEPADITLEVSATDASVGVVRGRIPIDYRPPLPGVPTLVQTFAIADPSAFARTAFIEALEAAGVTVRAAKVGPNPAAKLPAAGSYAPENKIAELVSLPYAEYARLILKVSHNLGANLSLMLFGLTEGARTVDTALAAERRALVADYGLTEGSFDFPTNGSGSPDSRASPEAVTGLLQAMRRTSVFHPYFAALPILGVDGSLATIGRDPPNPVIAPGIGHVHAKTGTTLGDGVLKAQVFAGYLDAKSGARLAYLVYVNNVAPIGGIADVIKVFSDEGEISSILFGRY